jgi:hypothetical protein
VVRLAILGWPLYGLQEGCMRGRVGLIGTAGDFFMRTSVLYKPALIMAAGAVLAGSYTMAGTAGAAVRSTPASHRGTVPPASHGIARRATGFANWQMFRGNLAHTGVSPETGINTANASTLTAGWSAWSHRPATVPRPW